MCGTHPGPWVAWAGPMRAIGELPPIRLRAILPPPGPLGPAGARRPGSARGSEEPGAGDQEPGARRPDPAHGHREHDSGRVRHSEVTVGKETGPWCGSSTERGRSSFSGIFYKPKDGPPRSRAGTGAGLREFAVPGAHGAPHPVSPLQAVGSQARGQGVGSRQAESSSLGYPKTLEKWSQGGHAGSGHLDWCRGLGPSSVPAPVRVLSPRRGTLLTSSWGHIVVSPTRRDFQKEPRWHLSNPSAVPPLASLRLVQLVPEDSRGLQGGPADTLWTSIFGVLEGPRQRDCAPLCVSGPPAQTCPCGETEQDIGDAQRPTEQRRRKQNPDAGARRERSGRQGRDLA